MLIASESESGDNYFVKRSVCRTFAMKAKVVPSEPNDGDSLSYITKRCMCSDQGYKFLVEKIDTCRLKAVNSIVIKTIIISRALFDNGLEAT